MKAWRVVLVNSTGLTTGPLFASTGTRWAITTHGTCRRHEPPVPREGCTCGVYGTRTREALAPVVEYVHGMLAGCARPAHPDPHTWDVLTTFTQEGVPVLLDPQTAVLVLEGTLADAVEKPTPTPWHLVPLTRRQTLPPFERALAAFRWSPKELGRVWFHAPAAGSEPEGTVRGSSFTATAVHAVDPPAWLVELVDPLPLIAHPDPASLTGGAS